jgi:hypothetical protein
MRYMAYREFRSAVDGARLGPVPEPEPGAGTSFKLSDSQVKRYNDAILELARHYVTYFHTAPNAAKRAAVRSVAEVLDTSRKCGGED